MLIIIHIPEFILKIETVIFYSYLVFLLMKNYIYLILMEHLRTKTPCFCTCIFIMKKIFLEFSETYSAFLFW